MAFLCLIRDGLKHTLGSNRTRSCRDVGLPVEVGWNQFDDLTAQRNEGVYVNGYLLDAEVCWLGLVRSALGGLGRDCLCG